MQDILRLTIRLFLAIFAATAILTVIGLAYLWFGSKDSSKFPYLGWLLTTLIAEVIGVIIMVGKRGLGYLPTVQINKDANETSAFMKSFISHGSSVTIVSNRLSWLTDAAELLRHIEERSKSGTRFEIITAQPVNEKTKAVLVPVGVQFFVTGAEHVPEARFTLINADRSGAERLAIAKGTHPNHEITIFDASSGPQIIGLAKDIIRKSKVLSNAG